MKIAYEKLTPGLYTPKRDLRERKCSSSSSSLSVNNLKHLDTFIMKIGNMNMRVQKNEHVYTDQLEMINICVDMCSAYSFVMCLINTKADYHDVWGCTSNTLPVIDYRFKT